MEFFINKNSTLNVLKLELIQDGRNDFDKFYDSIQNANIYFSMSDVVTGVKKIGLSPAFPMLVPDTQNLERYYIAYQFTAKQTSIAGRYRGEFTIEFLDGSGTLIVPIREQLYVNILEGDIRK